MEHTSDFDLNSALSEWLDQLRQSPQFRQSDVVELESHIRDSVSQLQTQGLSTEESFMVATKRVGTVEKLEPEFGKVRRSPKLVFIHLAILVFFSVGCWFLWALLKVATLVDHGGRPLPLFTVVLCQNRMMLVIPPVLALIYCLLFVFRKNSARASWVAFFAISVGALVLLLFPVIVAVVLPLFDAVNNLLRQ